MDQIRKQKFAIWLAAVFAFFFFEPNRHPQADRWDSGRMHDLGYLTDIWARRDGRWQVVARHSSILS